jgi:hypothetical protein
LKTTTDSVEWVRGVSSGNGRDLGATELGGGTEDTILVLLVRVVSREGVEETEVGSTVWDDSHDGNTNTVVESSDSGRLDSLGKAVNETTELTLSDTDIGSETGTGVVKWVDDQEGTGSGKTSSSHVDEEEFSEFGILVGLREHGLDGVLERKVEGLGREVTDDVGHVTTPEGADSLLTADTGEAVNDTGVTLDLSGDNLWVGILGLDEELHTLNWRGSGLGDSTRETTGKEIDKEIVRHDGVCVFDQPVDGIRGMVNRKL